MSELVYCRTCKRRHRLREWIEAIDAGPGIYPLYLRDDSAWCPKRKARYVSARHERTGRPMPI